MQDKTTEETPPVEQKVYTEAEVVELILKHIKDHHFATTTRDLKNQFPAWWDTNK